MFKMSGVQSQAIDTAVPVLRKATEPLFWTSNRRKNYQLSEELVAFSRSTLKTPIPSTINTELLFHKLVKDDELHV
jgi:hypothetical protein